jgi:hypothetical protein
VIAGDVGRLALPKPALQSLARNAQLRRRFLNLEEFLIVDFDLQLMGLLVTINIFKYIQPALLSQIQYIL